MKLSEIKGEKALEVLADLIDPIKELLEDDKLKDMRDESNKLDIVKYLLKQHKKEMLTILALISGENPETYEPTILTLPVMVMDFLNDPDVAELFGLQGQPTEQASSGSATENIEATEE